MLKDWIDRDIMARYVSLEWAAKPLEMARDRFHPGLGQYRHWAELVSEQILDLQRRIPIPPVESSYSFNPKLSQE